MQTEAQIARKFRRMATHLTVSEQDAIIAKRVAASQREASFARAARMESEFVKAMGFHSDGSLPLGAH